MDIKDKIVGLALAALIALIGWNLHETWAIGKQKILTSSSITLRKHMMRKLVWKIKQMISKIKVKRHLKYINRTLYGKK